MIEGFRARFPDWKIALTFFSASGFDVRKNWAGADLVFYLPADTPRNARDFLAILQPDAAVFVKYEFWANHLFELQKRRTPTFLIAALFRPGQPFFWPIGGGFWRKMLGCFDHIFLQNDGSKKLLDSIGFDKKSVVGDPRIDRVLAIAEGKKRIPSIEKFLKNEQAIVCGSTWPEDEKQLTQLTQLPHYQRVKFIVAPHDVSKKRIAEAKKTFPRAVLFSEFDRAKTDEKNDPQTLIVDSIGLLSSLYFYGKWAYVGGGFGAGIHNTLEPAAFSLPVVFGPRFEKFEEARRLVAAGGFFSIDEAEALFSVAEKLENADFRAAAAAQVEAFLTENRGAAAAILDELSRRLDRG